MNTRHLIEALSDTLGISRKDSKVCVDTIFDSTSEALTEGGRIGIRGLPPSRSGKTKQVDDVAKKLESYCLFLKEYFAYVNKETFDLPTMESKANKKERSARGNAGMAEESRHRYG